MANEERKEIFFWGDLRTRFPVCWIVRKLNYKTIGKNRAMDIGVTGGTGREGGKK